MFLKALFHICLVFVSLYFSPFCRLSNIHNVCPYVFLVCCILMKTFIIYIVESQARDLFAGFKHSDAYNNAF